MDVNSVILGLQTRRAVSSLELDFLQMSNLPLKKVLQLYCKPVELYNIIQQRAIKNPPSLQRCLHYKIDAKRKKSHLLLQRREFFHPQKAQRMEPEEVFADHDSEDKVDDDIADFEDRRMLDDFVDVSKDEKRIMHMWNSFVRKQSRLSYTLGLRGILPAAWTTTCAQPCSTMELVIFYNQTLEPQSARCPHHEYLQHDSQRLDEQELWPRANLFVEKIVQLD